MRVFSALLFSVFLLVSCNNDSKKNLRIIPKSVGNINNLNVVVNNLLWETNVGETIRDVFAAPLDGLPQEEPIFKISQTPSEVFSGFVRNNRIVLKIIKGTSNGIKMDNDVYAKPQTVVFVSGQTNADIINQLHTNAKKIIDAFNKEELKEKRRRIKISPNKNTSIETKLGLTISFPSAYIIAKEDEKFFWIRKRTSAGTMDIMLYEVPIDAIRKGDSAVVDIVNIRNIKGEKYIRGENDDAYVETETAYAPYIFDIILDNKPTYETKGIWIMKNDYMSGPFINYAIEDKINNRYVIIEGYAYAPSAGKRDYVFELEAIIKSVKIK